MNVVDRCKQIKSLKVVGNITPNAWYQTIVTATGKADLIAIAILADVRNWYIPKTDGSPRFKGDKLQISYGTYADRFGCSKKRISQAINLLVSLGAITVDWRNIKVNGMTLNNVLFVQLEIPGLRKLTFPEDAGTHESDNTPASLSSEQPDVLTSSAPKMIPHAACDTNCNNPTIGSSTSSADDESTMSIETSNDLLALTDKMYERVSCTKLLTYMQCKVFAERIINSKFLPRKYDLDFFDYCFGIYQNSAKKLSNPQLPASYLEKIICNKQEQANFLNKCYH